MDNKRRKFIKNIGAFSIWGMGAGVLSQVIWTKPGLADFAEQGKAPLAAIRWGMVVDLSKCDSECTDCIEACHFNHNVPEIEGTKEEIKWLWKEEFANTDNYHQETDP